MSLSVKVEPGMTFDDLVRIVDLIDAVRDTRTMHIAFGDVALEVTRRPASPEVAPGVAGTGPVTIPVGAAGAAGILEIRSPAVGFLRLATVDGAKAAPGLRVSAGEQLAAVDVLGELEPVCASADGTLAGILAEDGAPVEHGQAIFLIG